MRYVSRAARTLTGYAPGELLDNARIAFGDLIYLEDREPVWDQVQQAVREGRRYQIEYRIHKRDETTVWVWDQGRCVAEEGGKGPKTL